MQYRQYRLNIWDVGGQKTLRSYWRNYYEQTDGLIWVVDSADVRRLEDCRQELHKLLMVRTHIVPSPHPRPLGPFPTLRTASPASEPRTQEERLSGASLLVFANKQDLAGALSCDEIRKVLELDNLGSRHWQIISCSAVTGEGLLKGFDWIVGDIGERIYLLD